MDSFTTQDCSHYSTAPFTWLTDIKTQERMPTNNITPGLFIKNDNPITANIDKESQLVGLHNIIGKCENVDVQSLNKAKELSSGLQRLYDVQNTKHDHSQQQFLNNTRLTQPEQSVTELNYNRFEYLPYNPQALNNVAFGLEMNSKIIILAQLPIHEVVTIKYELYKILFYFTFRNIK